MALTLIKEDGSGLSNSNSYADLTDGNAYYDAHLYPLPWTLASFEDQAKALVMATRLIDAECRFNGFRAHDTQALQWPRERCPDPDRSTSQWLVPGVWTSAFPRLPAWVASNIVPKPIVDATCEMARELLIVDRTAAPPGEGIDIATTGAGATYNSVKYSKRDTRRIFSEVATAMLSKYGALLEARFSNVKLVRS